MKSKNPVIPALAGCLVAVVLTVMGLESVWPLAVGFAVAIVLWILMYWNSELFEAVKKMWLLRWVAAVSVFVLGVLLAGGIIGFDKPYGAFVALATGFYLAVRIMPESTPK